MGSVPTIAEVGERLSRTVSLDDDVARLRYVSGARRDALLRVGVPTVGALLHHMPHRYLDFSCVTDIARADVGDEATVVAVADRVQLKRPRPRMQVVEIFALDATGVMQVSFFRQPWIAEQVKEGDRIALSGKVTFGYGFKQMRAPLLEVLGPEDDSADFARILPVHPVAEGITVPWMRRIVSAALADAGDVCDFMPSQLLTGHRLMGEARALRAIHFPRTLAERDGARRRLAYDELLCLQLALVARQRIELRGIEPTCHVTSGPRMRSLLEQLPFALTDEQRQAADDILADMAAPRVMGRLLLGDVGTGKTVVAALALAAVADSATQAAMMAPTSVLARQYAERLGPLLDAAGISWGLVTGATAPEERAALAHGVADGTVTVVFGTTAVLSDDMDFSRLTLVVIDEQHRFGVGQRTRLRRKGAAADLLAMTATPIPRTLALSVYGDMSCSRICHRPCPGASIETHCIAPESLDLAFGAIREAVAVGHQAYVVCPLVDERDDGSELDDVPERERSGATGAHAATQVASDLSRTALSGLSLDLLTGRMGSQEKDEAMERFRAGRTDVLVSTTVIEVGVDVPNATVMLVFDADRFGLATLHQLRGRVGRGDSPGVVYLSCAARKGTPARRRLAALEATSDGLELAELDLRLRHEGEVLGYRQSGGPTLKASDLVADADLVEWAHEDARRIAEEDPTLSSDRLAPLAYEVTHRFGAYFEEVEQA